MGAKPRLKRDFDPRLRQRAERDVDFKSEVARLLDKGGGPETSEIAGDGNRAPTHAEKKSRFSARFSLSMGSVLSARLLDLMLAGHSGSSLGSGVHGEFEPRRAGLFRPR